MTSEDLAERLAAFQVRMLKRVVAPTACVHDYSGQVYKSSSGRRICGKCGEVTAKPFASLGVAEGSTT